MTIEYSQPVDKWPLLLCGPVLRRVSFSSVAVFIATSKACKVTLQVQDRARQSSPWQWSSPRPQDTLAIGERLHVVVAELTGIQLQPGVVYEYDVQMMVDGQPAQGLVNQGDLLRDPYPLGYTVGMYPSFSMPASLSEMRLLHGSCRKPHGGGRDGLVIADELVRIAHETSGGAGATYAGNRPHLLLLTGDQIYADDVSAALLMTLRSAGKDLVGRFKETFVPGDLEWDSPTIHPGENRMAWLKQNRNISSGEGANHLMYLAEFYAMYILCWSEVLWPTFLGGRTVFLDQDVLYPSRHSPEKRKALTKALEHENKILGALVSFAVDVRRVRRALANIPTMMTFDDHEITDDWNLDAVWNDNARTDPTLNRIVRNGLIAYAVFQAWGNDPQRFNGVSSIGTELLRTIAAQLNEQLPKIFREPDSAHTFLDLGSDTTDNTKRVLWDWILAWDWPGGQLGFQVISLDTRTHRDFSNPLFAGLLQHSEIERQLTANRPPNDRERLCFVISPAPVIGHPVTEEIVQPLVRDLVPGKSRSADYEAWSVKRESMEHLLLALSEFKTVVLLSGDVHYAFTNHTVYHRPTLGVQSIERHVRIVQLCSSALKNSELKTRVIQAIAYAGFEKRGRGWFGTNTPLKPMEAATLGTLYPKTSTNHPWDVIQVMKLLDTLDLKYKLSKYAAIGLGVHEWVESELLALIYWTMLTKMEKLTERPLILPEGPWFSNDAHSIVSTPYDADGPGAWQYKTEFVRDWRGEDLRYDIIPDGGNTGARGGETKRHFIGNFHSVIGEPNLGEIRITMMASPLTGLKEIEHRIHWWLPGEGRKRALTVHVAPLTTPTSTDQLSRFYV